MTTFIVILLLVGIVLIVILLRNMAQGGKPGGEEAIPQIPKTPEARAPGQGELIHDNVLMQKELKEFSDELLKKIDTRIGLLKKLVKEADDRIDTLEAMAPSYKKKPAAQKPAARPETRPGLPEDKPAPGGMSRRTAILSLARKGLSVPQIAQQVGMGRGEVEFILNVERKRNS